MPEPPVFHDQSSETERQPLPSLGGETAVEMQRAEVQRELRFESGEDAQLEVFDPSGNGPKSRSERACGPSAQKTSEGASSNGALNASKPLVLAKETTLSDGSAGHVRQFAVGLRGLAQPRDEEEQKRAERAAQAWHRNLLGVLSRWTTGTQFRLRYRRDPARGKTTAQDGKPAQNGKPAQDGDPAQDTALAGGRKSQRKEPPRLSAALVVVVEARGPEVADMRAERISRELLGFLQGPAGESNRIYNFSPVTSEETLRGWLAPFAGGDGLRLSRRPIPLESPEEPGIGFGTGRPAADGPTADDSVGGDPVANSAAADGSVVNGSVADGSAAEIPGRAEDRGTGGDLRSFVRAMLRQTAPSLLDVSLRPTELREAELSRLRSLARGTATDGTALSRQEEQAIVSFSENLIQQAARCFEVDVVLGQPQPPVSRALQAAVERSFFGGIGSMETETVSLGKVDGLLRPLPVAPQEATNPDTGGTESGEDGSRICRLYATGGAARLFRFPFPTSEAIPGIRGTHPGTGYVPTGLSGEGPLLGKKVDRAESKEIRVHPEDMFRHVYILGQTGTGKTTMLSSMMMERLEAEAGMGLIDPHGDLYDQILQAVPEERREDVVLFDPASEEDGAKLNLLEYDPERPRQRTTLINELFQIFDQEYDLEQTGGPIFERYMRNALLLVMDDPEAPGTLLDVVRLFQDREYRDALLAACENERVVRFWQEAERTPTNGDLPSPENMSIYVTSKLSRFLDDDYLRSLVGQRRSTIDFQEIIDGGKILLVKMQKGRLGQLGVRMFGTIVVARLMMAALSREEIPEEERRDFFLFVDEFQSFTTPTLTSLLSEARKYRLSLTLANQTLHQLDDEITEAVLGNVGSLVALRPGVKDYNTIEPYVSPPFRREEIVNLPNYTAVGRLLAGGEPTRPFLFETTPRL